MQRYSQTGKKLENENSKGKKKQKKMEEKRI